MTSKRFRQLANSSNRELEAILRAGQAPQLPSLVGSEWCGYNTPAFAKLLGIQKFIKGFFQGPQGVEGYNTPALQNGIDGPWLAQPSPESPRRFGFYTVTPVDRAARDNSYPEAVLLDYGASRRNERGGIARALRDYLVQPDPANPDILLGKAYFALGSFRVPSSFFILERRSAAAWKP
jgi:hypothetical protein